MRTSAGLLLLLCSCQSSVHEGGPDPSGECFVDSEPTVRAGRVDDEVFFPLEERATLELINSPQGGFGVLLDVETQGVGASEGHLVTVDITARLDTDAIAVFHLADAPLMCDGESPGRWGPLLLTLDQDRYVVPSDLDEIEGREVVLAVSVFDAAGLSAQHQQIILIEGHF